MRTWNHNFLLLNIVTSALTFFALQLFTSENNGTVSIIGESLVRGEDEYLLNHEDKVLYNETFMTTPIMGITHIKKTESSGLVRLTPHPQADPAKKPVWRVRLVGPQIKLLTMQRRDLVSEKAKKKWLWEASYQIECPGAYTIEIISEQDDFDETLEVLHKLQYRMFSLDDRPFLTPYQMHPPYLVPEVIRFESRMAPSKDCQLRGKLGNEGKPIQLASSSADERTELPFCTLKTMNMSTASWVVTDKNETWVAMRLNDLSITNSSSTRDWVLDMSSFGGLEFRFANCRMRDLFELNARLLGLPEPYSELPPIKEWPLYQQPTQLWPYKFHPPQQMDGWKAPKFNPPLVSPVCFNGDSTLEYIASYASGTFYIDDHQNTSYPANYTSSVFYRDSFGTQLCSGVAGTTCGSFITSFGQWPLSQNSRKENPKRPWNASEYEEGVRKHLQEMKNCGPGLGKLYWLDVNANGYTRSLTYDSDYRTEAGTQLYNIIARKVAKEMGITVLEFYPISRVLKDMSFDMCHHHGIVGYELARAVLTAALYPS